MTSKTLHLAICSRLLLLLMGSNGVAGQNFAAHYRADFSEVSSDKCLAYRPIIHLLCKGDLVNIDTPSDYTCVKQLEPTKDGFNGYICTSTCEDGDGINECDYFLSFSTPDIDFGSIFFSCQGDDYDDVDAAMIYSNTTAKNSCGTPTSIYDDNRYFHLARMNIFCPDLERDDPTAPVPDYYVTEDTFFECTSNSSFGFARDSWGDFTHEEVCAWGKNCGYEPCGPFDVEELRVDAKHNRFPNCVEALGVATIPDDLPVRLPAEALPDDQGTYAAQYSVGFGLFQDDGYGSADVRTDSTSLSLHCDEGGDIEFVRSTSGFITCVKDDSSSLTCSDDSPRQGEIWELEPDASTYIGQFQYITYECSATDRYPTTHAVYNEEEVGAANFYSDSYIGHAMTLGIFCGTALSGEFRYTNAAFECQEVDALFHHKADDLRYELDGDNRFTCFNGQVYLKDDLPKYEDYGYENYDEYNEAKDLGITETVPTLTMHMDATFMWDHEDYSDCYSFSPVSVSSAARSGLRSQGKVSGMDLSLAGFP